MKHARLDGRAFISVTGEAASKFLQSLVTCDVEHLAPGEAQFGALLAPQGKIMFDFFVVRTEAGFLIDVTAPMRDDLVKRLTFYKLRAKVAIEPTESPSGVFAIWDGKPEDVPAGGMIVRDPRLADLGYRLYADTAPEGEVGDYAAHRIAVGMPEGSPEEGGGDFVYGDAFPHEVLMDQFPGVDFTKGCYVGQEVVSRMQHRGTARKRVIMVEGELPAPGATIETTSEAGDETGGKPVGTMGRSSGTTGLAMLRLDRVREALDAGQSIGADGKTMTAKLQPWVKFGWPQG